MADLAAAGRAHAPGFAHRIWREVVVQQERLLVGALQRVDELLVLGSAEGRDHQRLRLTTGEQRRTVGPRQHADFRHDRPDGFDVTAIDALAGIENVPAHDLGFELLEHAGDCELVVLRFGAFREEVRHHLFLDGGDGVLTILLAHDRIGRAQILLGETEDFFFQRLVIGSDEVARFFRGLLGELDDRLDHRLEMPVAEHHRAEHDFLGQLLGFRFHHHHRILCAGDDEIELAFRHLIERWIEHVLIVDEADAGTADRAHERRAGDCQCRRRSDHRDDVGVVFHVVREHGDGHLRVAAPAVGEQRTNRAVDQARCQRILFGGTAFALEIAAGNSAGCVIFFGVVDGQRKKIDSFLWLLGRNDGGKNGGLAIFGEHGSIGLPRHPAGFEG